MMTNHEMARLLRAYDQLERDSSEQSAEPAARPKHPSLSELSAWNRAELASDRTRNIENHVEVDGCRLCQARLKGLEAEQSRLVRFQSDVPLRLPHTMHVAAQSIEERSQGHRILDACSEDGCLIVKLYDNGLRQVVLEIAADDRQPVHTLVCLELDGSRVLRFAVFAPHGNRRLTEVVFPMDNLYSDLGGQVRELFITPVDEEQLTGDERQALWQSAADSLDRELDREAWRDWAADRLTGHWSERVRELAELVQQMTRN